MVNGTRSMPPETVWEKLGASLGLWAVLWLGIHYVVLRGTTAHPSMEEGAYVAALLAERMAWEWATFLRVVGGLVLLWFMASLALRLRLAEGGGGRLANVAFALGVLWAAVWLLSAFFNSVAILLATDYANPAGARVAGALGREAIEVLTPGIAFALVLAVAYVALRFDAFPRWYGAGTAGLAGLMLVLAIADWYGAGTLSDLIVALSLGWIALTSALLIPTHRPPPAGGAR